MAVVIMRCRVPMVVMGWSVSVVIMSRAMSMVVMGGRVRLMSVVAMAPIMVVRRDGADTGTKRGSRKGDARPVMVLGFGMAAGGFGHGAELATPLCATAAVRRAPGQGQQQEQGRQDQPARYQLVGRHRADDGEGDVLHALDAELVHQSGEVEALFLGGSLRHDCRQGLFDAGQREGHRRLDAGEPGINVGLQRPTFAGSRLNLPVEGWGLAGLEFSCLRTVRGDFIARTRESRGNLGLGCGLGQAELGGFPLQGGQ